MYGKVHIACMFTHVYCSMPGRSYNMAFVNRENDLARLEGAYVAVASRHDKHAFVTYRFTRCKNFGARVRVNKTPRFNRRTTKFCSREWSVKLSLIAPTTTRCVTVALFVDESTAEMFT